MGRSWASPLVAAIGDDPDRTPSRTPTDQGFPRWPGPRMGAMIDVSPIRSTPDLPRRPGRRLAHPGGEPPARARPGDGSDGTTRVSGTAVRRRCTVTGGVTCAGAGRA